MANFFVFLVIVGIGSLFGPIGFVVGVIIGAIGWHGSASKNKVEIADASSQLMAAKGFSGADRPSKIPTTSIASAMETAANVIGPHPVQLKEYTATISQIFSCFLNYFPKDDLHKANKVTNLVKSDDWVVEKLSALELMANELQRMQKERQESPMLFLLRSNVIIERALRLPSPMRMRLATHMETLIGYMSDTDSQECKDLITAFHLQLRKDHHVSEHCIEAEKIIMRSNDPAAINTLQRMRKEPSRYRDILRSGASGNAVLKTALGVFAGLIAAEAVRAAITDDQKESLLRQLDHNIDKAGGLDNILLNESELDVFSFSEPSQQVEFANVEDTIYTSSVIDSNGGEVLTESFNEFDTQEWNSTVPNSETEDYSLDSTSSDSQEYVSDASDILEFSSDSGSDYSSDD
jgi:hypothetical protein